MFLDVTPAFLIEGTITTSEDYLHSELANVTSDFTTKQMSLLLEVAQAIEKSG